ncbi:amidohydrolase family protein [Haloarculaceae archaeon H-GB2-1]|nr:amidohydrolase family protein [Haloarculaceae archaeon H-GB1-1]MEA5409403.1 amidohydrolase family protein [Haloarculaceae archaeon H-GB2-1]
MSDGDDPTDRDDGHDLVVTGGTVVSPEQGTFRADIAAADGVISRIAAPGSLDGDIVVDARGRHVLPGVVDPHVHHGLFRPLADDADTESRSGLVGGVTTTGNIFRRGEPYGDIMAEYRDAAERNYRHDYFFTLGLLYDEHVAEVPDIVSELGITSFKWYGNYKLQTADRFGLDRNLLDDVADGFIQELSALDAPTTLAYHAENAEITERLTRELKAAGREDYDAIVEKFPGYAEAQAAVAGSNLARQHDYDDDFYVVHVSAKETAQNLAELQSLGYGVTAETCTHYLALTAEECDQRMRINPPVRSQADQDAIWTHLREGTIDCVGTDHIANTRAEKAGEDIWDGLWGSPSSATLLPLVLSEGVAEGRISLERAAAVTSANNAKAYDLYPKKGAIRVGSDADLVVVDLDETRTVTPDLLQSAADYSMYEGREVTGWPTQTVVRGELAFDDGEVLADPGYGTHVDRPVEI